MCKLACWILKLYSRVSKSSLGDKEVLNGLGMTQEFPSVKEGINFRERGGKNHLVVFSPMGGICTFFGKLGPF